MHTEDSRQEWSTPDDFFGVVDAEFDFQLDVAATTKNAKCIAHITPETDALNANISWTMTGRDRLWLNPGFNKPAPWFEKAYHASQKRTTMVVVVLGLISPSTGWWRDWAMKASEIRLVGGRRIQFVPAGDVKLSSNPRENALYIFRHNPYNMPPVIRWWDWTKKELNGGK